MKFQNDLYEKKIAPRLRSIGMSQTAPPFLRARVMAALDAATAARPKKRFAWTLSGSLLAAAAAAFWWISSLTPTEAARASAANQLLAVIEATATDNATFETGEPAPLVEWFSNHLNTTFAIPVIPNSQLTGGYLSPLGSDLVAAVTFDIGGRRLTYIVAPYTAWPKSLEPGDHILVTSTDAGYEIALWREGETVRAVMAVLTRGELLNIAAHCRNKLMA